MADGVLTLFRVNGRLTAIDDACIRCFTSLSGGKRRGVTLACPVCGWRYDLRSGAVVGIPDLRTATYEVRRRPRQRGPAGGTLR